MNILDVIIGRRIICDFKDQDIPTSRFSREEIVTMIKLVIPTYFLPTYDNKVRVKKN
jgi:hypothetical protein